MTRKEALDIKRLIKEHDPSDPKVRALKRIKYGRKPCLNITSQRKKKRSETTRKIELEQMYSSTPSTSGRSSTSGKALAFL